MRVLTALLAVALFAAAPDHGLFGRAAPAWSASMSMPDTVPEQTDEHILSAVPDDLALLYLDKKDFADRLTAAQKAARYAGDMPRSAGATDPGLDWLMLSDEEQNESKLSWFREQSKSRGVTVAEVEKYVNLSAYRTLAVLQIAGGPALAPIEAPVPAALMPIPEIEKKIGLRSEAPIEGKVEALKLPGLKGILDAEPEALPEPEIEMRQEYVPKIKRSEQKPKKKSKKKKKKKQAGGFDPIEPAYMRMYELDAEQEAEEDAADEEEIETMDMTFEPAPPSVRPSRKPVAAQQPMVSVTLPPIRLKPIDGMAPPDEESEMAEAAADRVAGSPIFADDVEEPASSSTAGRELFIPRSLPRPNMASMRTEHAEDMDQPVGEKPDRPANFGVPTALNNR